MKKILLILLLLSLVGCTNHIVGADIKEWEKIDSPLKLEAEKEKILESKTVDWIVEKKDINGKITGEIENKGKIKEYDYITEKKVIDKVRRFEKGENYSNIKTIKVGAEDKTIMEFWLGDHYYKDENGNIYEIEHGATTTIKAFEAQTKKTILENVISLLGIKFVIATDVDYYAGAGDGQTRAANATWTTARNAATGSDYTNYAATTNYIQTYYTSGNYKIMRTFLPFDTSALPDDATISAATSSVFCYSDTKDVGDFVVVAGNQASQSAVVAGDYDGMGSTEFGRIEPRESRRNNIVLNASGRGFINKTGYTKLGIVTSYDFDNTAPVDGTSEMGIPIGTSERAGTVYDPYLSVTYTSGGVTTPAPRQEEVMWFN